MIIALKLSFLFFHSFLKIVVIPSIVSFLYISNYVKIITSNPVPNIVSFLHSPLTTIIIMLLLLLLLLFFFPSSLASFVFSTSVFKNHSRVMVSTTCQVYAVDASEIAVQVLYGRRFFWDIVYSYQIFFISCLLLLIVEVSNFHIFVEGMMWNFFCYASLFVLQAKK